jgi:hypothetical protein
MSCYFVFLGRGARESDGETISEEVTYEMAKAVQAAVDKIVAAAKAKTPTNCAAGHAT